MIENICIETTDIEDFRIAVKASLKLFHTVPYIDNDERHNIKISVIDKAYWNTHKVGESRRSLACITSKYVGDNRKDLYQYHPMQKKLLKKPTHRKRFKWNNYDKVVETIIKHVLNTEHDLGNAEQWMIDEANIDGSLTLSYKVESDNNHLYFSVGTTYLGK